MSGNVEERNFRSALHEFALGSNTCQPGSCEACDYARSVADKAAGLALTKANEIIAGQLKSCDCTDHNTCKSCAVVLASCGVLVGLIRSISDSNKNTN